MEVHDIVKGVGIKTTSKKKKCKKTKWQSSRGLFKKMRDTKGVFFAKMGTIKGRNGMDLTEAEDIKERWQKYIKNYTKKMLMT